jgi:tetratricopeptide (TPR) repeat protein
VSESRTPPSSLAKEAKTAFEQGDLDAAIHGFTAARDGYHQSDEHLMAAEMANNLSVVFLQADRPEESLVEVRGTPQLFLDAKDEYRAAMAFGNLASALEATGDLAGAEDALEESIRIFKEIGEKDNLMHAARALSQLQLRRGQAIEAVSTMQTGLEGQAKLSLKNKILRSILSIPSRLLGR